MTFFMEETEKQTNKQSFSQVKEAAGVMEYRAER